MAHAALSTATVLTAHSESSFLLLERQGSACCRRGGGSGSGGGGGGGGGGGCCGRLCLMPRGRAERLEGGPAPRGDVALELRAVGLREDLVRADPARSHQLVRFVR